MARFQPGDRVVFRAKVVHPSTNGLCSGPPDLDGKVGTITAHLGTSGDGDMTPWDTYQVQFDDKAYSTTCADFYLELSMLNVRIDLSNINEVEAFLNTRPPQ